MDADVVVIGGGSAGLQAALTLGRMRFEVTVIDTGAPSNAPAHAIGGLLGAHAVSPLDLLATGRGQLAELPSVQVIDGEATRVDDDHTVTLAEGARSRLAPSCSRPARTTRSPMSPASPSCGDVRDPLPVLPRLGGA